MKRMAYIFAATALLALFLPVSAMAAEVAQGPCKEYSPETHTLVIEEYDTNFSDENKYGMPTGIITKFDVSTAKIGLVPEPGDILRIAYVIDGNVNQAIKVMNVTKQDLMKK